MQRKKFWMIAAILICGLNVVLTSCKEKEQAEIRPVAGILEDTLPVDTAPSIVHEAMNLAFMDRYENLLDDKENGVSVWNLVNCNPGVSSEGFGLIVIKNKKSSNFPDIYHGRNPRAHYDAQRGILWIACGAMEGTGVQVERLYMLRFNEKNEAHIVSAIDPYDMQQVFQERLNYSIEGDEITFYEGHQVLCRTTNHVNDMGGFDEEQPIWIGEQIRYDLSGANPRVEVVPGVKFTTGLVLTYDDMPSLTAIVDIHDDGSFEVGKIGTSPSQEDEG